MLNDCYKQGRDEALGKLGLKTANELDAQRALDMIPKPSLGAKLRGFGQGQLDAAKDLFGNLRGGLGGKVSPDVLPHSDPAVMRQAHRARAVGNLRTLAPSLIAGGALYAMHQRRKNQGQAQQQAQAGYPA